MGRGETARPTGVDRVEEHDEAVMPWLRACGRRARDGLGVVDRVLHAVDPVRDVVVLGSSLHRGGGLGSRVDGGILGCHYEYVLVRMCRRCAGIKRKKICKGVSSSELERNSMNERAKE